MVTVYIPDEKYEQKYGKKIEYMMDERLKIRTDEKIKKMLQQNDKDFFAIVDGAEGSGKSWFAIQWAKYVDPSLDLSRIVFTPDEFKEAIQKAKKGQAVVYDEAFTGIGSRSSLSATNRVLVSLAMQIRQKNLFVVLVQPSVFLLDKYFVMFRSKCLVHIYENHGRRGYFRIYNQKKIKKIILLGAKTMSYSPKVYTKFRGRFYGKFGLGEEIEDSYRKKKAKALENAEKTPMNAGQIKYREQRDTILYCLRKITKMSYREIESYLGDYDIDMTYQQIRNICAKRGDKEQEKDKKELESIENESEIGENSENVLEIDENDDF